MKKHYDPSTKTLTVTKNKRLTDMDTGEVINCQQVIKTVYGQKNFWKVYLIDFLSVLGILDSKQLDVLIYILENTDKQNNLFIGTQASMAENCGVSRPTVHAIIKKLLDNNFIKMVQNGVYQINPSILIQGRPEKQGILMRYYCNDQLNDKEQKQYGLPKNKKVKVDASELPDGTPIPGEVEDELESQMTIEDLFNKENEDD